MSQLRAELPRPPSVADFARAYRHNTQPLASHIAATIRSSVPAYATGVSVDPVQDAVSGALTVLTESLIGPSVSGPKVDRLFQQLGFAEAQRDEKLADLRYSLYIAVREASVSLRGAAVDFGLDIESIEHINNAVFILADHFTEQADKGRQAAIERGRPQRPVRDRLLSALIEGDEQTFDLAEQANWEVPEEIVVLATPGSSTGGVPPAPPTMLARADGSLVACAPDHVDDAIAYLQQAVPRKRIAVTWPVARDEVGQAVGWAKRLIYLVRRKVIEDQPILHCEDHETMLWLHAEPALREHLYQELLGPLLAQNTTRMGYLMSETLLVFLETRGRSAARDVADRLGIHVNSFRYRFKQINDIYGESLKDPEFALKMLMALKATVPLWKVEDLGDDADEVDAMMRHGD